MITLEDIERQINFACWMKCGKMPEKEADCKGLVSNGFTRYTCDIRRKSDNINFALERGWSGLVEKYFEQLCYQTKIIFNNLPGVIKL